MTRKFYDFITKSCADKAVKKVVSDQDKSIFEIMRTYGECSSTLRETYIKPMEEIKENLYGETNKCFEKAWEFMGHEDTLEEMFICEN